MSFALTSDGLDPPAFLRLAGHPLRWRLLSELARSDRMVSELTARVGEPQNLVSYHLGKLRLARLVHARRSDADGRDTYYGLAVERFGALLAGVGAALHPGLGAAPPPVLAAPEGERVLFLCTGNSARSQMAEALLRARGRGAVEVFSAGSQPKPLHPNAVRAMREAFGLDITNQASKPIADLAGQQFDWVISLCDRVREACPEFPGAPGLIHWSLENPAAERPDDETWPRFQALAAELSTRIDYLLAQIAADRAPTPGRPR